MKQKHAAALSAGDQITLYGHQQTVTDTKPWNSGDIAVYTDYTGDNPWLLKPAERVAIMPQDGK